jgi:hypothetical protein
MISTALSAIGLAGQLFAGRTSNGGAKVAGEASSFNDGSKFNKAPTAPNFDAYQIGRRGTGAHDMTLNRPLAVKRFAENMVRPTRPIQKKIHMRRQVGPKAAAWMQHIQAEALIPDPPFYGESKAVSYNRRLIVERVPRIHKGLTIVDRELHEFNKKPMIMWYHEGHPRR